MVTCPLPMAFASALSGEVEQRLAGMHDGRFELAEFAGLSCDDLLEGEFVHRAGHCGVGRVGRSGIVGEPLSCRFVPGLEDFGERATNLGAVLECARPGRRSFDQRGPSQDRAGGEKLPHGYRRRRLEHDQRQRRGRRSGRDPLRRRRHRRQLHHHRQPCTSHLLLAPWANPGDGGNVGEGGGIDIRAGGPVTIVNSTITGNEAVTGGGGVNIAPGYQGALGPVEGVGGPLRLRNSIIAGNTTSARGSANCKRTVSSIISLGYNLDDDGSCLLTQRSDLPRVDPRLGAFGDHGGPTDTYSLRRGSPALDAADDCPPADQRGVARPQGAACDIGSFELEQTRFRPSTARNP